MPTRMASGPDNWVELVLQLAHPTQLDWVALESGGRRTTVRELGDAMLRAASALSGDPAPVAVCAADPILHTVAVLGAAAAGRTALLVDHKHPNAVLADAAARAGATAVVGRDVPGLRRFAEAELAAAPPLAQPVHRPPSAIGSILLTSGSTGAPKLVQRSLGADLHAATCLRIGNFPIARGDRFWLCVTHAGAPFLTLVMGSLLARATVVFAPFDAASADAFLARERITCAYLVPTMIRLAREHGGLDGPGWRGLRALKTGGERLDDATAALLLEKLPGRVFCAYGATEILNVTQATFEEMAARPGTVGRENPLRAVRVVRPGTDEPAAIGEEGEVLAGGAGLFSGYLGEGDAPDWYRTGDLGHLDGDGYLYVTGRATSVVQVGGNRVSTDEVAALLRTHEAVAQAAVIAVDDPTWTHRLEAFVVLHADATGAGGAPGADRSPDARPSPDADALRAWLGERLPRYKVPRGVRFLAALPLDGSGKLSLRTLREAAEA